MQINYILPEIIIFSVAIVVLLLNLLKEKKDSLILFFTILGIFAAFVNIIFSPDTNRLLYSSTYITDNFSMILKIVILAITALVIFSSWTLKAFLKISFYEFVALILIQTSSIMLILSALDLIIIYICLELISITSYVLTGTTKDDPKSKEAAIKYLLFGAVASCFMLYGMSLIYGITGTTNIHNMSKINTPALPLVLSIIFMLVGFGFKIASFPFHLWCPDVYEGAPTSFVAYLSTASKIAGFAVIMRIFDISSSNIPDVWIKIFTLLATFSMFAGNIIAIPQKNIKRLLAYSSIAQIGYILIGVTVMKQSNIAIFSVILYLIVYALANIGIFATIAVVQKQTNSDEISDYAGLSVRSPFLSASLTIFLLSLLGIPPLAGFFGKFYIFASAIDAKNYFLAIVGIINTAISAYYYVGVIKVMYLSPPLSSTKITSDNFLIKLVIAICVIFTLFILLYPSPLIKFVEIGKL